MSEDAKSLSLQAWRLTFDPVKPARPAARLVGHLSSISMHAQSKRDCAWY